MAHPTCLRWFISKKFVVTLIRYLGEMTNERFFAHYWQEGHSHNLALIITDPCSKCIKFKNGFFLELKCGKHEIRGKRIKTNSSKSTKHKI